MSQVTSWGKACAKIVRPQTRPGGGTGSEILDEHVGPRQDAQHEFPVVLVLDVDRQRLLAPVEPGEIGRLAVRGGVVGAGEVAVRAFELDDPRPGIGEPAARQRRGDGLFEGDDQDPVEGACIGGSHPAHCRRTGGRPATIAGHGFVGLRYWSMQVLVYHRLDPGGIPNFAKVAAQLEAGDFRSADVKKVRDNLYRARLDQSNRLLFSFARYRDRTVILLLEYIARHAYDKSRFLVGGATVDEGRLPPLPDDGAEEAAAEAERLAYLNDERPSFHLLDKVISFDDAQHEVFALPPPLVVIGSAGSGKTVLTLEKMKQAAGEVLYVTRSPYLVDSSRTTYYGLNYANDDQEMSFLSYAEFIESVRVPETREMAFPEFARWFARHRVASRLKDPHQLFEEFNGVITGSAESAWLDRDEYLDLGIRQSIYPADERARVHDLFMKYVEHLNEAGRHDVNILSHDYQSLVEPRWDFVVIDEVQDFTNVQMDLVLRTLKTPGSFILCGDSNQIVHPNFFSWSGLKRHFHGRSVDGAPTELIRVLSTNYRNSQQVTEVANRILRLKHARFGSIDRESNHLVTSNADQSGAVLLLADEPAVTRELDDKTHDSTRFAVIVMHAAQKAKARQRFRTPLVFSIQEAKGLEYDNVILFDFVSGDEARFREITRDVHPDDVHGGELRYARARDKSDKSLEIFKFHINALYVAATRAVANVYVVESAPRQPIFDLLGVELLRGPLDLEAQASSLAEWQREAQKLERQGKEEQAEEIRSRILGIRNTPWTPLTREGLRALTERSFDGGGKKAMLELFDHALLCRDGYRLSRLRGADFRPAKRPQDQAMKALVGKHYTSYSFKHAEPVRGLVQKYGVDHRDRFNFTPLMAAARFGNEPAIAMLADMAADTAGVNSAGLTAFQIMLAETWATPRYAERTTPNVYRHLMPATVSVMVEGRLVKLHSRQAEFLFCNLFFALFHSRAQENARESKLGLAAGDVEEALRKLPRALVPEYRTRRGYISGVLARNEVDRDERYNRRLFKRTSRGFYILNPGLHVRIGEDWVRVYDLLEPETLFTDDLPDHLVEQRSTPSAQGPKADRRSLNERRLDAIIESHYRSNPAARRAFEERRKAYRDWALGVFAGNALR